MMIKDIPDEIIECIGDIRDLSIPTQGHTSSAVLLTTHFGQYILKKTSHPLYNKWLEREFKKLIQLETTSLPIPKVIKFVEKESACWLLISYIEGIRLREYLANENDKSKRERVIHSYGDMLRRIHCTVCPESIKQREKWLTLTLMEAEYNLNNYDVDGTRELLDKLKSCQPEEIEYTLIHGDFTIDNVIVNGDSVVGVIDWGGAAYGDPRYDIALAIRPKLNAFDNEIDKCLFFEAYRLRVISQREYEYFADGLYQFF